MCLFNLKTEGERFTPQQFCKNIGMINSSTECVIASLLLSLAGAEMIREAKTYTKPIIKISDLKKDDQVIVQKGDDLVAQYFCHEGICENKLNSVGQLKKQSEYLVLILQNISPFDRFDASHNANLILRNFTLDEVPPTSTTPPLAEAHTQRISQTEPPNMPDTTKAFIGVGVALALALAAIVAIIRYVQTSGRDGRIARAIAFFRRRFCDPAPNQPDENSREMQDFLAVGMDHGPEMMSSTSMESVQWAQNCME